MSFEDFTFFKENICSQYESIWRYAKTLVDKDEAHEITQEVMLKALTNLEYLKECQNIEDTLFTIAKRTAYSWLRKKRIYQNRKADYPPSNLDEYDDSCTSILEEIVMHEDQEELLHAVNSLSLKYSRIIDLYYFHGLSMQEIAEILNVNYSTAVNRKRRALEQLQKNLMNGSNGGHRADRSRHSRHRMADIIKTSLLLCRRWMDEAA